MSTIAPKEERGCLPMRPSGSCTGIEAGCWRVDLLVERARSALACAVREGTDASSGVGKDASRSEGWVSSRDRPALTLREW